MKKISKKVLHQHWVHSHEEDTDTERIFRPATFSFPRSRGRTSFELKPDGNLIEGGMAPTDGCQEAHGTWELKDHDRLVLQTSSPSKSKRVLQLVSAEKDRLVVKK